MKSIKPLLKVTDIDPHKELSVLHYDWLTAVLPLDVADYNQSMYQSIKAYIYSLMLDIGFLPDVQPRPLHHGIYRYDDSSQMFDGTVILGYPNALKDAPFFNKNTDKAEYDHTNTVMIQISGRGLDSMRQMLSRSGHDLSYFVDKVLEYKGWFSRVDIALDLYNFPDDYSPMNAYEQAYNGLLVTHSRTVRWMHSFSSRGAIHSNKRYSTHSEGTTFYIGKTPNQLRIYNKKAERDAKVGKRFNVDSWYRWEFELNNQPAKDFITDVLQYGLVDAYKSRLRMHRFINDDDSNRSRCSNQAWYDVMINNLEYTLTPVSHHPTYESTVKWFRRQVSGPMASLYAVQVQKFIENGLSQEDAELMALKTFKSDYIDAAIHDERVDWNRVTDFFVEHTDSYGRNEILENNIKDAMPDDIVDM